MYVNYLIQNQSRHHCNHANSGSSTTYVLTPRCLTPKAYAFILSLNISVYYMQIIQMKITIYLCSILLNMVQNMFISYFYSSLIDKFTRVDEKRGTSSLLDNIYTNVTHTANDIKSGLFKTQISDLGSLLNSLYYRLSNQHKTFMEKRDFNNKYKSIYKKR